MAINKPTNGEPQLFVITQPLENTFLLSAFGTELEKIGYEVGNIDNVDRDDVIHFDTDNKEKKLDSLNEFKCLEINSHQDLITSKYKIVEFVLPKDWDKALAFAKSQLELPYWNTKKGFEINGYDIKLNFVEKTFEVDRYEGVFQEIIDLYEFHVCYITKYPDSKGILKLKLGCQTIDLKELNDLYNYITQ